MREGARLSLGDLLVADFAGAVDIVAAVGVVNPAVGLEFFDSRFRIIGIRIQGRLQPLLGLLVLPQAGAVHAVDNAAPALAEGVRKLVAVQQQGNRVTDSLELGRAKVTLEVQHAVAGTVKLHVVEAAFGDDVQSGVDLVAVGHGVIEVEGAGLERVGPGRVLGLGDDDLLDARLLTLEVARVVRVDGQGRLQGALVKRNEVVRAGGNTVLTRVETGVLKLRAHAVLGEVAGDVAALAVVLQLNAVAQPILDGERLQLDVAQVIVVRNLVRNDGHGEGVIVNQADAGNRGRGAVIILLAADIGQITGHLRADVHRDLGAGENLSPDIVRSLDFFAVVVGQTLVDGDGERLAAIRVDDGLDVVGDGRVHDIFAALIRGGDRIIVGQITDHLVGGVVGPPGIRREVAADFGGRTIHDGSLLRRALGKRHRARGNEHSGRQKHGKKLLHGYILPEKFLYFVRSTAASKYPVKKRPHCPLDKQHYYTLFFHFCQSYRRFSSEFRRNFLHILFFGL